MAYKRGKSVTLNNKPNPKPRQSNRAKLHQSKKKDPIANMVARRKAGLSVVSVGTRMNNGKPHEPDEEPEILNNFGNNTELRGVMQNKGVSENIKKHTEEYLIRSEKIDNTYGKDYEKLEKDIIKCNEDIIQLENDLQEILKRKNGKEYNKNDDKDDIKPLRYRIKFKKEELEHLEKRKQSLFEKINVLKDIARLEIKSEHYGEKILEILSSSDDQETKDTQLFYLNQKKNHIDKQIDELKNSLNPKRVKQPENLKPRSRTKRTNGNIYMSQRPNASKKTPMPRGRRTRSAVVSHMASDASQIASRVGYSIAQEFKELAHSAQAAPTILRSMAQNAESRVSNFKKTGNKVASQMVQNGVKRSLKELSKQFSATPRLSMRTSKQLMPVKEVNLNE
jgi:hypothetical protein